MSRHLSPENMVAAMDGTLDPARAEHLNGCGDCQRELAALGGMLREVEGAASPAEPSPLFWDHFSARVRDAVAETSAAPVPAWRRWWQPVVGLATVSLLAIWLLARGPGAPPPDTPVAESGVAASSVTADEPWDAVVQLAADLSVDEVDGAVPTRFDTVALFDDLTADEQATLADLLRAEMKGLE
jgi:hypothetical protein